MKRIFAFVLLLLGSIAVMAQSNDTLDYYNVEVDPNIVHGTLNVRPTGLVQVGARVRVSATPDPNYTLESIMVYNEEEPGLTVEILDDHFVMPDFDVMVTATFVGDLPVILEDLVAPAAICAGESLSLIAPQVQNADEQGWMLCQDDAFQATVNYTGQPLDISFNGWRLIFWASNRSGTVYSNIVSITVQEAKELVLSGDLMACTMQECNYSVKKENGATYKWEVSDPQAELKVTDNSVKVRWATAGNQIVTVEAEFNAGCSASAEMGVLVQSFVNASDVNAIVAKKHNGKDYILIYPNPKDTYRYQWYKDGEKIEGANGQYYHPKDGLADGQYQVYLSFNADAQGQLFCGAFSAVYTVRNGKEMFSIWPNPSSDSEGVSVTNESQQAAMLSIFGLDGKLLYRQQVGSGTTELGIHLSQGLYFCHFSDESGNHTVQKLVVQ